MTETLCDVRALSRVIFSQAQNWWYISMAARIAVFGVGAVGAFLPSLAVQAPYWIAALSIIAALLNWRSEELKSQAESLKRKDEGQDLWNWPISPAEISDLLARLPQRYSRSLTLTPADRDYYASTEAPGSRRAVEGVQESAWWSKHLTEEMTSLCVKATIGCFLLAVVALLIAVKTMQSVADREATARVVLGVFSLVFALGLAPLASKYARFAKRSEEVERRSMLLREAPSVDEVQAIKLLHEYQLSRSGAPLIPTLLYNLRCDHLNRLWKEYRAAQFSSNSSA